MAAFLVPKPLLAAPRPCSNTSTTTTCVLKADGNGGGRARARIAAAAAVAAIMLNTNMPAQAGIDPTLLVPLRTSAYVEVHGPRLVPHWEQRSERSQVETYLLVSNATKRTLDLMWIDYAGAERQYATIRAGETVLQPTYATHRWAVRDHTNDSVVLFMVARPEAAVAVIGLPDDAPGAAEHASNIVRDVTHHHAHQRHVSSHVADE